MNKYLTIAATFICLTLSIAGAYTVEMKKDLNQTAADIVAMATGAKGKPEKDPAAQAMGRKGGKARADSLTKEERSAIAKKGAKARWGKKD